MTENQTYKNVGLHLWQIVGRYGWDTFSLLIMYTAAGLMKIDGILIMHMCNVIMSNHNFYCLNILIDACII